MKQLRVLMASPNVTNPYVSQLVRALTLTRKFEEVCHSVDQFSNPCPGFDVVHIQWPEALVDWQKPTMGRVGEVESTIARWRSFGTKVVVTVHNESPHVDGNAAAYRELYRVVYSAATAFIHLGERSVALFEESGIRQGFFSAGHFVVPHGNYECFLELRSGSESTDVFPNVSGFKVVVFGQVRTLEELRLLDVASVQLENMGGFLTIVGRLPLRRVAGLKGFLLRRRLLRKRHVRIIERFVPDADVACIIAAADAVFIPRVKALNSGNVALGFTFGKVVIGPDIGVIGEELSALNNPVYIPSDETSVKKALLNARVLFEQNLGVSNRQYAVEVLRWDVLAESHMNVYASVTNSMFDTEHVVAGVGGSCAD